MTKRSQRGAKKDDRVEVFFRWLPRHSPATEKARLVLTVASLVCDDDAFCRLCDEAPGAPLDDAFIEEFLSHADPRETVKLLKSRVGPNISPGTFARIFDRTLEATSDTEILSGLMFVAGMYLDRHPGAFQLPRSLAERLLASADYDHLLAGMKAIRHSGASVDEVIASYIAAMNRADWEQRCAALHQLSQFVGDLPRTAKAKIADYDELSSILRQIASTAPQECDRDLSRRCITRLEKIA